MTPNPEPLPMAPSGCELDDRQLADQLDRYGQLSNSVLSIERSNLAARVQFAEQVDTRLLEETLTIELGAAAFFELDYDRSARVLTVGTEPGRGDALSMLLSALTSGEPARTSR